MLVIIRGGLGNQMFQAAFAAALEHRFGVVAKYIDFTPYARYKKNWELSCFGIKPKPVGLVMKAYIGFIYAFFRKIHYPYVKQLMRVMDEDSDVYNLQNMDRAPNIVMGYWQNIEYFLEYDSEIKKLFVFPVVPSRWNVFPTNTSRKSSVAIHVRRGDYVSDPEASKLHLICDTLWYQDAWKYMRMNVDNCYAIVFSDDINWARENLSLDGEIYYVSNDLLRPPWVDMANISSCKHHILSNSSFGWWAAFLGCEANSIVVAPKYWYSGVLTSSLGIAPKSWVLL